MLTMLFFIMMFVFCFKMLFFALKATWGIAKILFVVCFFPLILVGMVLGGLLIVALPIIIIAVIVSLLFTTTKMI